MYHYAVSRKGLTVELKAEIVDASQAVVGSEYHRCIAIYLICA